MAHIPDNGLNISYRTGGLKPMKPAPRSDWVPWLPWVAHRQHNTLNTRRELPQPSKFCPCWECEGECGRPLLWREYTNPHPNTAYLPRFVDKGTLPFHTPPCPCPSGDSLCGARHFERWTMFEDARAMHGPP